jgi:hypothetical protein
MKIARHVLLSILFLLIFITKNFVVHAMDESFLIDISVKDLYERIQEYTTKFSECDKCKYNVLMKSCEKNDKKYEINMDYLQQTQNLSEGSKCVTKCFKCNGSFTEFYDDLKLLNEIKLKIFIFTWNVGQAFKGDFDVPLAALIGDVIYEYDVDMAKNFLDILIENVENLESEFNFKSLQHFLKTFNENGAFTEKDSAETLKTRINLF